MHGEVKRYQGETIVYLCLVAVFLSLFPTGVYAGDGTVPGSFIIVDAIPPAAVTDLSVAGLTLTSVTLMWTAPGDDGNWENATRYDIRYSQSPISTGIEWNVASRVSGAPAPGPTGSRESFNVTSLSHSTEYWFALKTADDVFNWSNLSNSVKGTTLGGSIGGGGGGGGNVPSYQLLRIEFLGAATVAKVSSLGKLLDSYVVTDPEHKCKLEFDQGTRISSINGETLTRLEMRVSEQPLPAPGGMRIIGPCYDLIGYGLDSAPRPIKFNQAAKLTLSYDPSLLPESTSSVIAACYDTEQGWRELELSPGSAAGLGKITMLIEHVSTLAILARLMPSPPVPARFKLSDLIIKPARTEVGGSVTVTTVVQNAGEIEGGYTLTLKIDGKIEQSKQISLASGESTQVSFTIIKDEPGTYAVAIDGITGGFTVLAPPSPAPLVSPTLLPSLLTPASSPAPASPPPTTSSPSWISIYWWLVLFALVIMGLLVYYLAIRPQVVVGVIIVALASISTFGLTITKWESNWVELAIAGFALVLPVVAIIIASRKLKSK